MKDWQRFCRFYPSLSFYACMSEWRNHRNQTLSKVQGVSCDTPHGLEDRRLLLALLRSRLFECM